MFIKTKKKSKRNTTANVEEDMWLEETVARNGTKMEMIGGLFAIFVAKLIIYNAVVYSTKHHNTGQFSLTKFSLSVQNAN